MQQLTTRIIFTPRPLPGRVVVVESAQQGFEVAVVRDAVAGLVIPSGTMAIKQNSAPLPCCAEYAGDRVA
jgi:hypothetical protein